MSLRGIGVESMLNIISGTTRFSLFTVLLTTVMFGCAGAELLQLRLINEQIHRFVSAGASTIVVEYANRIDGYACESLASLKGVQAAGAFRMVDERLVPAALPTTSLPTLEATPGGMKLLASANAMYTRALTSSELNGVWLSQQAAEVIGSRVGDDVSLIDGSRMHIAGVYASPDDGRASNMAYAVVMPTPYNGGFDSCMVKAWPMPQSLESLALISVDELSEDRDDQPRVRQLNTNLGAKLNSEAQFASRMTVQLPWLACVLAMALGFVSVWLRRLEFASALHCGVSKTALGVQILFETASWAIASILLCSPLFVGAWRGWDGSDGGRVVILMGRSVIGAFAGVFIGSLIGAVCVRERNLFRYFKNCG